MSIAQINPAYLLAQKNDLIQEAKGQDLKLTSPVLGESFKGYLNDAVKAVNTQQIDSQKLKVAYAEADPNVSLSNVMIQMQKAQVSLTALVTVRNKVVDGYKTLMNMSV